MKRTHGSWFAAALVPAVFAGSVYLQAGARAAAERQSAHHRGARRRRERDADHHGFDFGGEVPTVTLGMSVLPVMSMTESGVATGVPEVLPGTCLLALSWTDGAGAVFYPTLGAVGPAGPQGSPARSCRRGRPRRPRRRLSVGAPWSATSPDHAGLTNTHFGDGALASVTTAATNSAFGQLALTNLTTGKDDAAFGRLSMRDTIGGEDNLAIGTQAMLKATTASFNMAFGSGALEHNLAGDNNVACRLGGAADQPRAPVTSRSATTPSGSTGTARATPPSGTRQAIATAPGATTCTSGAPARNGESGIIRIGDPNTHTKTVLVGEVEGDINVVPVYQ